MRRLCGLVALCFAQSVSADEVVPSQVDDSLSGIVAPETATPQVQALKIRLQDTRQAQMVSVVLEFSSAASFLHGCSPSEAVRLGNSEQFRSNWTCVEGPFKDQRVSTVLWAKGSEITLALIEIGQPMIARPGGAAN